MADFNSAEKGVAIRQGASANFLINSADRTNFNTTGGNSADFTIAKNNSLLNGFFTRLAPNEVCLDWCVNNIDSYWGNNQFLVQSGTKYLSTTIAGGQYTAAQALAAVAAGITTAGSATSNAMLVSTIANTYGEVDLVMTSNSAFTIYRILDFFPGQTPSTVINLPRQLGLAVNTLGTSYPIDCPKILPTQYIDFISPGLTYNQNVKDGSTSLNTTDSLYRWYFAWDVPEPLDTLGFPIYQGYKRFVQRREISFPKQIRWSPNMPIGQLSFQVEDDQGRTLAPLISGNTTAASSGESEMEWCMTLLASET